MARSNKYTSLNFNDIYEKKITNNSTRPQPSQSASSSFSNPNKTILSNSRIHGHMLVLSRPTPKPITHPTPSNPSAPQQNPVPPIPDQPRSEPVTRVEPDSISLRPLGRTGTGPSLSSPLPSPKPDKEISPLSSPLPKTDRFVPPHLRQGFVGREEKPGPDFQKPGPGMRTRELGGHRQGYFRSSPNGYGEDGRPQSGGGYERMRGGESDLMEMRRPGSSGSRPSSSG
ncbi:unnamed protein product [Ilex paraguariensis]|uniref:Uncharacterized protein n=1 Tax=Ilex paraguariensis TaxID=185542 RepID=A0ABC8SVC4_9AQUA